MTNYDLPKTYTVSYFDYEKGQNIELTLEQLEAIINPSEFKIVNKNESYQSWKVNTDNPGYGPVIDGGGGSCSYTKVSKFSSTFLGKEPTRYIPVPPKHYYTECVFCGKVYMMNFEIIVRMKSVYRKAW